MDAGYAAVGWKLPADKGDFRLSFNGLKETAYEFSSTGYHNFVAEPGGSRQCFAPAGPCLVRWWQLEIDDGDAVIQHFTPTWSMANDLNGNQEADVNEVQISGADDEYERLFHDSLQNQVQTIDGVFGREFGKRRFSSRWWGGLRYFQYKGNIPAAAWLLRSVAGQGFTDIASLMPLNLAHESSGFGPTGSWEVDFNFFERRVQLFARGQIALIFSSIDSDTGDFLTYVFREPGTKFPGTSILLVAPARLSASRDKTTWQNVAELGGRYALGNGLKFELNWSRAGYLDALLTPLSMTIPETELQVDQGASAVYKTRDIIVDAWRAVVGFQF
jgi:hypothetical protein